MTSQSQSKQRSAEPSIVVDPSLSAPSWSSEETVVFRREMLDAVQPPKKSKSLRPALLLSALLVLAAIALRLSLHR